MNVSEKKLNKAVTNASGVGSAHSSGIFDRDGWSCLVRLDKGGDGGGGVVVRVVVGGGVVNVMEGNAAVNCVEQ